LTENKKALEAFKFKHSRALIMVPRVGIEPTTPGLGNLCSIQLSYRGMGQNIRYAEEKNANYKA
jgi:hypothetical protein